MKWGRNKKMDKPSTVGNDNISETPPEVKSKAREYLQDQEKLRKLINDADTKVNTGKETNKGFVKETWENLKAMVELVRAYLKGEYRQIPYGSLLLIVGAIAYFVMPADTIPDFIAVFGLTDDAAVIGFTLRQVKKDLDKFIAWKNEQEINEFHSPNDD